MAFPSTIPAKFIVRDTVYDLQCTCWSLAEDASGGFELAASGTGFTGTMQGDACGVFNATLGSSHTVCGKVVFENTPEWVSKVDVPDFSYPCQTVAYSEAVIHPSEKAWASNKACSIFSRCSWSTDAIMVQVARKDEENRVYLTPAEARKLAGRLIGLAEFVEGNKE